MARIHVGQTALRLEFVIDTDITGYTEAEIRYEKPNTLRGAFPAQVEDEAIGKVYYDVESTGDLDDTGQWNFWVHIKFRDGTELDSDTVTTQIYQPGTPYLSHPYGLISLDGGIIMPIEAFRVIYNNTSSGLSADDVQAAIDELNNLIAALQAAQIGYDATASGLNVGNVKAALDKLATDSSAIAYDNSTSGLTATNIQDAIDELKTTYHP